MANLPRSTPENGLYLAEYDVSPMNISHETLEHSIVILSNDDPNKPHQFCDSCIYGVNMRTAMPPVVSYQQ